MHIATEDTTHLPTGSPSLSLHNDIYIYRFTTRYIFTFLSSTYACFTPYPPRASPLFYARKRHPTQTTLFQYLPNEFRSRYDDDDDDLNINEPWDDAYKIKNNDTIRIWYTNPCGLGLNPNNSKSHNAFAFLSHHSQADVICLAETNLRWPSLKKHSTSQPPH